MLLLITITPTQEVPNASCSDGSFGKSRPFTCPPKKGFYVYLNKVRKDSRFQENPDFLDRSLSQGIMLNQNNTVKPLIRGPSDQGTLSSGDPLTRGPSHQGTDPLIRGPSDQGTLSSGDPLTRGPSHQGTL